MTLAVVQMMVMMVTVVSIMVMMQITFPGDVARHSSQMLRDSKLDFVQACASL